MTPAQLNSLFSADAITPGACLCSHCGSPLARHPGVSRCGQCGEHMQPLAHPAIFAERVSPLSLAALAPPRVH